MEPSYLEMLQKLGTPETFTAIGVLAAGWAGWKVAGKTLGVIGGFASKASFAGLAATILALAGMGTAGFGVGEIATRRDDPTPKVIIPGVQNDELENFAKTFNGHSNPELAKLFMDYTRERDGFAQRMSDELIQDILTKTNEHNQQASVELIKLFRAREERRLLDGNSQEPRTASNAPVPMYLTSVKAEESYLDDPQPTLEKDESSVSLPVAYSMLFGGIASAIGGCIVAMTRRHDAKASVRQV